MKHQPFSLLLHDIRSVHNVGSMFRTADAAGVDRIYTSGVTPTPLDRFGRKRKDFAKVALGAEDSVPWEVFADPLVIIEKLRGEGYEIVALEQSERSVDYRRYTPKGPVLLIVGNEVGGVPHEILALADTVVEIPQHGTKESLNVSVACGVALFHLVGAIRGRMQK